MFRPPLDTLLLDPCFTGFIWKIISPLEDVYHTKAAPPRQSNRSVKIDHNPKLVNTMCAVIALILETPRK